MTRRSESFEAHMVRDKLGRNIDYYVKSTGSKPPPLEVGTGVGRLLALSLAGTVGTMRWLRCVLQDKAVFALVEQASVNGNRGTGRFMP